MKKKKIIGAAVVFLLAAAVIQGGDFFSRVKSFTLENGMKFFVLEQSHTPLFAGVIMVKAGSVDETEGQRGLAHFLEHMSFKGTPVIGTTNFQEEKKVLAQMHQTARSILKLSGQEGPSAEEKMRQLKKQFRELQDRCKQYLVPGAFENLYNENGGQALNAGTNNDITLYYVKLPANRLELWFLVESERIKNTVFRGLYLEKEVVLKEKKMEEENNAYGALAGKFLNAAFSKHPYRHPVTGYESDIMAYTTDSVSRFQDTFYIPDNMMAAIVGDVKLKRVKKLARQYFGDLPKGAPPPRTRIVEPKQSAPQRITVPGSTQRVMMGFRIPPYPHPDNVTVEMIDVILSHGSSSRMGRDLVSQRNIAASLHTFHDFPGSRYPTLYMITAQPRLPHTCEELEQAIYEHLEILKHKLLPGKELQKAINLYEVSLYQNLTDPVLVGIKILENTLLFGDINLDSRKLAMMKKITPADIRETAKRIFADTNRTVAVMQNKINQTEAPQ